MDYHGLYEKISKTKNSKRITKTQWTARAESVRALRNLLCAVFERFDEIHSLDN